MLLGRPNKNCVALEATRGLDLNLELARLPQADKFEKLVGTAGFEQSLKRLAQQSHINVLLIYTPKSTP